MKNIFCLMILTLLCLTACLTSCFKIDNWDEPDCTFHGTVYDKFTGQPLLSSQNDWQIKIWERSWTGHPDGASAYQELRIKQDGTYRNTKLFAGTYDMYLKEGPFWPDSLMNVQLSKSTQTDFTVEPYMVIDDFDAVFDVDRGEQVLCIRFKVKVYAMEKDGKTIPPLRFIRAFLSLTPWCGNGENSFINIPAYTLDAQYSINQEWKDVVTSRFRWWSDEKFYRGNGVDESPMYEIAPIRVKSGYKYYIRVGACLRTGSEKYNYSPIKEVDIP